MTTISGRSRSITLPQHDFLAEVAERPKVTQGSRADGAEQFQVSEVRRTIRADCPMSPNNPLTDLARYLSFRAMTGVLTQKSLFASQKENTV
jgi:hypothetical protein